MTPLTQLVRRPARSAQRIAPVRRRPDPTVLSLPAWLLLPGLAALLAGGVFAYRFNRAHPAWGLDMFVYRWGGERFLHGDPVYVGQAETFLGPLPFTYPPVTLLAFAPLSKLSNDRGTQLLLVLSLLATAATIWFVLGMLGYRANAGRLGLSAAVSGFVVWLEPFGSLFTLGQINAVLMLAVVADLSRPHSSRLMGLGVGAAAAVKLVPGIFVLYLLLTRRWRAAVVAVITFGALTAVGWIAAPADSRRYWLEGIFYDSSRVTPMGSTGTPGSGLIAFTNQSLHGLTARLTGGSAGDPLWYLLVAAALTTGMALAGWAHRRREEVAAVLLVAFTALLVSPVAWSHHWVWVAPLLVYLADVARRLGGRAQVVVAGLPAALSLAWLAWPMRGGPGGPMLPRGIIWHPSLSFRTHARLPSLAHSVAVELYTLMTLGLFVFAAWWLRTLRRAAEPPVDDVPAPTEDAVADTARSARS